MVETHQEFSHIWEVKIWDPRFSVDQDIDTGYFWHETMSQIRRKGDKLTALLTDSEDLGLTEAVREFCKGERMEDFKPDGFIPEGLRKAAWVDERSISGPVRKNQWLSAPVLYRILSRKVCIASWHLDF